MNTQHSEDQNHHRTAPEAMCDLIARVEGKSRPLAAISGVPAYIPRPVPPQPPVSRNARRARIVRRPLPVRWVSQPST